MKAAALFDRLDATLPSDDRIEYLMWRRREIENYLCSQSALEVYAGVSAETDVPGPLFAPLEVSRRQKAMGEAIAEVELAMRTLDRGSPWDDDTKVSDDFLTPLFRTYFQKLGLPNLMDKKDFYELADHVPGGEIDPEIGEKLDTIVQVAQSANPMPL